MAPPTVYLRQGGLSLNINDHTAYAIRKHEWLSGVAAMVSRGYSEVQDVIPIDVLGAANAATIAARTRALAYYLEQAVLWRAGEAVEPVYLEVTPGNAFPQKILRAIVTGWDPASLIPTDYMDRISTGRDITLALTITRRHPWLLVDYRYPQLYPQSAWAVSPGYPAPAIYNSGINGPYGGAGGLQFPAGIGTITAPVAPGVPIQAGQPYSIFMRLAKSGPGTPTLNARLVRSTTAAAGIDITGPQAITATGPVTVEANSQWLGWQFGCISTDAAGRLQFDYNVPASTNLFIMEVLVVNGALADVDDRWHGQIGEDWNTAPAPAFAGNPAIQSLQWPRSHLAASPVKLRMVTVQADNTQPGYVVVAPGLAGNMEVRPAATSATPPWSAVADAANRPLSGGNVLRFTPTTTAASTNLLFNLATAGTEITAPAIYVFLLLRNNSAAGGAYFFVKVETYHYDGAPTPIAAKSAESQVVAIPPTPNAPNWYPLGRVAIPQLGSTIKRLYISAQASAASGSLDCAGVMWCPATPTTSILQTDALQDYFPDVPLLDPPIIFDHGWDRFHAPRVQTDKPQLKIALRSRSKPVALASGSSMRVCWLSTRHPYWRHTDVAGNVSTVTFSGERLTAFPAPE